MVLNFGGIAPVHRGHFQSKCLCGGLDDGELPDRAGDGWITNDDCSHYAGRDLF
jgi:hypothetical protein